MRIFIFLISCILLNTPTRAISNQIILTDHHKTGSYQFAKELSRLWNVPAFEFENSLTVVTETSPQNRIERLRLRQGNFAILSPQNAYQILPENPEIVVISVLWPNVLYTISRSIDMIQLDTQNKMYVHENSGYFVNTWSSLLKFEEYNPSQFQWYKNNRLHDILSNLEKEVVLMTGPYPIHEISQFLKNDLSYKFIPLEAQFLSSIQKRQPWIVSRFLPATLYPTVFQPIKLAMSFPVLVTRKDTSDAIDKVIQKVLSALYSQQNNARPHPLFRFIDLRNNQKFAKLFQFHPVSKRFFQF